MQSEYKARMASHTVFHKQQKLLNQFIVDLSIALSENHLQMNIDYFANMERDAQPELLIIYDNLYDPTEKDDFEQFEKQIRNFISYFSHNYNKDTCFNVSQMRRTKNVDYDLVHDDYPYKLKIFHHKLGITHNWDYQIEMSQEEEAIFKKIFTDIG